MSLNTLDKLRQPRRDRLQFWKSAIEVRHAPAQMVALFDNVNGKTGLGHIQRGTRPATPPPMTLRRRDPTSRSCSGSSQIALAIADAISDLAFSSPPRGLNGPTSTVRGCWPSLPDKG